MMVFRDIDLEAWVSTCRGLKKVHINADVYADDHGIYTPDVVIKSAEMSYLRRRRCLDWDSLSPENKSKLNLAAIEAYQDLVRKERELAGFYD